MIEHLEHRIAPATFVVTSLNDSGTGSLRAAIAAANDADGPDVIIFKKGLTGLIQLTTGEIAISDTLSIKGPGSAKLVIDGGFASRIFNVTDGNNGEDSPLSVSGLEFSGGSSPDNSGGAINSAESLKVRNCIFSGNGARKGGAIAVSKPDGVPIDADIRNSVFTLNNATFPEGIGGAMFLDGKGSVTLKNNLVANNSAPLSGGGVVAMSGTGKTLLVEKCEFSGNRSQGEAGAAIFGDNGLSADTRTIVRNSVFAGNKATQFGSGGVLASGTELIIEKSVFTRNIASGDGGGGLAVQGFFKLLIRSSQFTNNQVLDVDINTAGGGGGIEIDVGEGREVRIVNSVISGNTSSASGGGISVLEGGGKVTITRSLIADNRAEVNGGGMHVSGGSDNNGLSPDILITKSKIVGNTCVNLGGGIVALGTGEFLLQSSLIAHNQGGGGGGLSVRKPVLAKVVDCLFLRNQADLGGAIANLSPLEVTTSKLQGNSARQGGGIYVSGDLTLVECIVSGNSALSGSGIRREIMDALVLTRTKVIGNFGPTKQIDEF